jgi:hypothetical protein
MNMDINTLMNTLTDIIGEKHHISIKVDIKDPKRFSKYE